MYQTSNSTTGLVSGSCIGSKSFLLSVSWWVQRLLPFLTFLLVGTDNLHRAACGILRKCFLCFRSSQNPMNVYECNVLITAILQITWGLTRGLFVLSPQYCYVICSWNSDSSPWGVPFSGGFKGVVLLEEIPAQNTRQAIFFQRKPQQKELMQGTSSSSCHVTHQGMRFGLKSTSKWPDIKLGWLDIKLDVHPPSSITCLFDPCRSPPWLRPVYQLFWRRMGELSGLGWASMSGTEHTGHSITRRLRGTALFRNWTPDQGYLYWSDFFLQECISGKTEKPPRTCLQTIYLVVL